MGSRTDSTYTPKYEEKIVRMTKKMSVRESHESQEMIEKILKDRGN